MPEEEPLTIKQAARKWGCCYSLAARWVSTGMIEGAYKRNGWEWAVPAQAQGLKFKNRRRKR